MTNIGTYHGIKCFEGTDEEYSKLSKAYKYCGDIYIINGIMIRNDIVIGYYDGKSVKEESSRVSYSELKGSGFIDCFSNMKSKNEMKNETKNEMKTETKNAKSAIGEPETALTIPSPGELKEYFDSLSVEVDTYLKEVGL